MLTKLGLGVLAGVLVLAMSIADADAKKVRGTETCDADKVDRTIQGKKYSCTHCSNSICDEINGQLVNCGIEHNYKDCEEKQASRTGTEILQSLPELTLEPVKPPKRPKVFQTPGTVGGATMSQ
jgi:hypothetical protein